MTIIPYIHTCSTESFIRSWLFSDTSICDELVEYFKNSSEKTSGKIFSGKTNSSVVDTSIKDSIDVYITSQDIESDNSLTLIKYTYYLQKVLEEYIKIFPFCNKYCPWTIIDTINIQYYKPGGGFKHWHCERSFPSSKLVSTRHLVFMTYLNTVDTGGETEFFHQNLKIKCIKGLTTIFPADWTYTHRGIPSEQEKYIITGWYNYIDK